MLDCNDDDICTDDWCDTKTGCSHALNSAPCDDGNMCTVGDKCASGLCKPTQWLNCDDKNQCTDDDCNDETGCTHVPNAALCDDGNECTSGDKCSDGNCTGSAWMTCDDTNICTEDACVPGIGCVYEPNMAPCDDGDPCTTTDQCSAKACVGSGMLECNDGNICTDDGCKTGAGCEYVPNSAPCSDSNACTVNDTCSGGDCHAGPPLQCDDGDSCTQDSCDPDVGCIFSPASPCCGNGIVEAPEQCDDGNQVNDDACKNDCTLSTPTVPGFSGKPGPVFGDGWLQCEGYHDKAGGDDIPKTWGDDCADGQYSKIKMVCGSALNSYRFIDVKKNVFKQGLSTYPESGLIYNSNFSGWTNEIYASGNHPHNSTSWWAGPEGCGESSKNTTINNSCSWEASNCFGQGINGPRYLWLYVKQ